LATIGKGGLANMITKTFKRHELKYFVTPDEYKKIIEELNKRMLPDSFCKNNGSYMIYNIYFDTANDDIIKHSLSKPYYREKLRMRSYAVPIGSKDMVFLELKKKINGIVAKRRAAMPLAQAMDFINRGIAPNLNSYLDNQVVQEITYFLSRYKVTPKVFISYRRVAYFDKSDHDFRVSFDSDILTRRTDVSLSAGDYGTELLDNDDILMEIKCCNSIPLWLCRILSEMGIRRTSFSKYGTEFKKYITAPRIYKTALGGI